MAGPLRSSDTAYAMSLHSTSGRREPDVGHDSDHVIQSASQAVLHSELLSPPTGFPMFLPLSSNNNCPLSMSLASSLLSDVIIQWRPNLAGLIRSDAV